MSGAASKLKVMMKFWRKGSNSRSTKVYEFGGPSADQGSQASLQGAVRKRASTPGGAQEGAEGGAQPGFMFAITATRESQLQEKHKKAIEDDKKKGEISQKDSREVSHRNGNSDTSSEGVKEKVDYSNTGKGRKSHTEAGNDPHNSGRSHSTSHSSSHSQRGGHRYNQRQFRRIREPIPEEIISEDEEEDENDKSMPFLHEI